MPHLKRSQMPVLWPLSRKKKRFSYVVSSGAHKKKESLPLSIVARDIFKLCEIGKEARKIVNNKNFFVDGREIKDPKFPVGLMDVLTIRKGKTENEYYRVLPTKKGFDFKKLSDKEANTKYCKIVGKKLLKLGLQINLHDGRNLLLKKEEKDKYNTGDTIQLNLKTKKIEKNLPYKEKADVLIVKGRNRGIRGKLEEIIKPRGLQGERAKLRIDGEEKIFSKDFIFIAPKNF